jgi:formate dehydrogenase beta subunit
MPTGTLQIKLSSGHSGAAPGLGVQREEEVCKYIDVTTCIGCKACEVACVEWNDMPFAQTTFDNTYQTMPSTAWNYWNLIKFNEHPKDDGSLMWTMRKDQCMHCEDPGCLRACPADGAIVQYTNGIVDFQQNRKLPYCVSGCPFDIEVQLVDQKGPACALCSDRVGQLGPRVSRADRLPEIRHKGRHARAARCTQLREHSGFRMRGCTIRRRSAARMSSTYCTTSRSLSCTAGCRPTRRFP